MVLNYSETNKRANVTVYAGPARSGKSCTIYDEIIDKAYQNPGEHFFLMAPEQSISHLERKLISRMRERHGQMGFFNLDILGFGRFCYRIFNELNLSAGNVLGEYGKSMLIRAAAGSVEKDLKYYRSSIDKNGFIDRVKSQLSELMQYSISKEDLENVVDALKEEYESAAGSTKGADSTGDKLLDFIRIMKAIEDNPILKKNYRLPESIVEEAAELLRGDKEISLIEGATFYFDNFRGFTPQQLEILKGLANYAKNITFSLSIEPELLSGTTVVEPYELFFNSMDTFRDLKNIFPEIAVRGFERCGWEDTSGRENMLRHLEKNIFRFPSETYKGADDGSIAVWKCRNPEQELAEVARDIRRKVRESEGQLRYRDFAVVTADLETLDNYIDSVFRDYEIPFFLDYERELGNNPYITVLLGLLRIVSNDFDYDTVFSCLKTGLFPFEAEDVERLENYVIRRGMRGRKQWSDEICCSVRRVDGTIVQSEDLELAEEVRREFMELISPLASLGKRKCTVSTVIERLTMVIGENSLQFETQTNDSVEELESRERYDEARVYKSLYAAISVLLEKTKEILGDMIFTIDELADILETGVAEIGIGIIPPVIDSVLIGDFERSKIDDISYLYIIDASDGILPRVSKNSCLITDYDRKKIVRAFGTKGIDKKLAPSEEQNTYYEQFYLYQMMAKPKVKLVVAYPIGARDGSSLEPSYIVGRLHKLFPMLSEENYLIQSEEIDFVGGTKRTDRYLMADILRDSLLESQEQSEEKMCLAARLAPYFPVEDYREALVYQNNAEVLEKGLMDRLKLRISVSKVQRYAECPYQFFLQYILGLTQRREHVAGTDDIGNVVHRALELIFEEVKEKEGNKWKTLEDEKLREIVRRNLDSAIEEKSDALMTAKDSDDGKLKFVRDNVERLTERAIEILKYQLSDGEMYPEFIETGFSARFTLDRKDGEDYPVTIVGSVDRGDIFEEDDSYFLRVIDYKTGNKSLNLEGILSGKDLQLTVYLDVLMRLLEQELKDKHIIPAGMYFYHAADEMVKDVKKKDGEAEEETAKKVEEKYKMNLRLRGIPNYDPYPEEKNQYHTLEIQEPGTVHPDSKKLQEGKILPISMGRTPVSFSADKVSSGTFMMSTEEYRIVREFSGMRLRELTEEILSGKIGKIRRKEKRKNMSNCTYCAYKPVCRFSEGAESGTVVEPKKDKKQSEVLAEIKEQVEVNRKRGYEAPTYTGLRFMDKKKRVENMSEEEIEALQEEYVNQIEDMFEDDGDTDSEE